ncbi:MAG: hypothetical protein ACJ0IZ_03945 [Verrucomicrobiales bacterium]
MMNFSQSDSSKAEKQSIMMMRRDKKTHLNVKEMQSWLRGVSQETTQLLMSS